MKKIFIAAIAAVLTLSGFNAVAQTQTDNNTEKTEQTIQKKSRKQGDCKRGFNRNGDEKCCKTKQALAFEGITLSADQQTKLDQLNAKQVAKAKEKSAQLKEQKQKARQQRMEARKQAKKEYLTEIKEILTPDQYIVYLENIAINQPQQKHMKQQGHMRAPRNNNQK